jgi:hypothetical protein
LPKDSLPEDLGSAVLLDWMRVTLDKNAISHSYNASRSALRLKAVRTELPQLLK